MNPDTFLNTPDAVELFALAKRCLALHTIGVVSGGNGSGKTTALKYIQTNPKECGIEGTAVAYFLAATAAGPTRGLKDFLIEREVKRVAYQKGLSVKILAVLGQRYLADNNIKLVIVDEADMLDTQSLQGFVSLADTCRDAGHPIGLILAGATDPDRWVNQIAAAQSRTLHYLAFGSLTVELIGGIFAEWGEPLATLAKAVEAGDEEAVEVLRLIHQGTDGNYRKLHHFAKLAATEHPGDKLTVDVVDIVFSKMTRKT